MLAGCLFELTVILPERQAASKPDMLIALYGWTMHRLGCSWRQGAPGKEDPFYCSSTVTAICCCAVLLCMFLPLLLCILLSLCAAPATVLLCCAVVTP
jgi:hypothetical protein